MLSRRFGWIAFPVGMGAWWMACGGSGGTTGGTTGTTTGATTGATTTATTTGTTTTGTTTGTTTTGTTTGTTTTATTTGATTTGTSTGTTTTGTTTTGTTTGTTTTGTTTGTTTTGITTGTTTTGTTTGTTGTASVLEHHLHATRDGAYTDVNVTTAAAGALKLDGGFTAAVTGTIYGQPLYVDGWQTGQDAVFVATNMNHVTALNATTGAVLWDVTLGPPVAQATMKGTTGLPCGQPYTSYGVMETPVIDLSSRTLYVESFQTPDNGTTKKHYVYALSIDTGATQAGWPVDVAAKVTGFDATTQNDRGGLTILNGTLYVPYAGLNGDCSTYHGWVVGVSTTNPATVASYSTAASQGGIWGAVASDGTSVYAVTGNTGGTTTWGGGEALIRFTVGPKFSGATTDYFTPSNWSTLDKYDGDLGSASAVLFDLPGATPSTLAVAAGKWGVAHLLNRANLGGVGTGTGTTGEGISSVVFAAVQNQSNPPGSKGTPASYTTTKGRYVVLHSETNITASACPTGSGDLIALTVTATNPPKLVPAWCAASGGKGSPIATTTDGTSNALVWIVSTGGMNQLLAFDGDTGASVPNTAAALGTIQHWTSPIEAKGRFIVGGTGAVYAYTVQ